MPNLIEIIGAPGSGKSFISSELETLKKNDEQIFFHSGNYNKNYKYKNLSILSKIFFRFKVIFKIIIFYLIFYKRLFSKKIYKGNFFFRVFILFYDHLVYVEILKKTLPNDKYLIMEPGPIMYFLQDYFYTNENVSNTEIKIFNKLFLNTDYIIHLDCASGLLVNRLRSRERGLPTRMRELNDDEIESTVKKSSGIINNYINKINNLDVNIIKIDSAGNAVEIKNRFLELIK